MYFARLLIIDWKNFAHCCIFLGLHVSVPDFHVNFDCLTILKQISHRTNFVDVSIDQISLLFELLMIRHGVWTHKSTTDGGGTFDIEEFKKDYLCYLYVAAVLSTTVPKLT
jgi:hypothetical protein